MIEEVHNSMAKMMLAEHRDQIVVNFLEFRDVWLEHNELLVMAEENTSHPNGPKANMLADAFRNSDAPNPDLVAIICDAKAPENQETYYLDACEEDISEISLKFVGRNFLLCSLGFPQAVLLMSDYKIKFLAGPLKFLEAYGSPIADQKLRFTNYVNSQLVNDSLTKAHKQALKWAFNRIRTS